MSPRIILHTPEPVSSPALYVLELARALTAKGVAVEVICPDNHQFKSELEAHPFITVHATAERSTKQSRGIWAKISTNIKFLLSSCAVLARTARRDDIVHFQYVLHFPFGALFFLIARLKRAQIFFTVHDPLPHKWLLSERWRHVEKGALKWSYDVSHCLIVHSEPGRLVLLDTFGQSRDKVFVVVHGPYDLGTGCLSMPASDRLEVLLFGALRENKGIHLAVEAVQRLASEGAAIRLTIAGSVLNGKEAGYWARCKALIAQDTRAIRVIERFIPDEQLPELFSSTHCVLLPYTRFFSDSGVAFMVLASGRPIVCTRMGGLAPLLDAAPIGIAIEEASVEGVHRALAKTLRAGADKLEELGRNGARYVLEECGWSTVASRTIEIYSQYRHLAPLQSTSAAAKSELISDSHSH